MKPEVKRKLQEIIYYRVKMWDTGREAEHILKQDVITAGDEVDGLACMCNSPNDAYKLEDKELETLIQPDHM